MINLDMEKIEQAKEGHEAVLKMFKELRKKGEKMNRFFRVNINNREFKELDKEKAFEFSEECAWYYEVLIIAKSITKALELANDYEKGKIYPGMYQLDCGAYMYGLKGYGVVLAEYQGKEAVEHAK